MKKNVLLVAAILVATMSFGQKKELKKAEKEIKSGNYTEALSLLNQAEGLIANADKDSKGKFYILKANALVETAGADLGKLNLASESLNMAKDLGLTGKNATNLNEGIEALKGKLESSASADYKAENYTNSAKKFYTAYTISPQDTLFLFNAALASKLGNDLDTSEEYYQSLSDMGYTGIQKQFVATNKETGKVDAFVSKTNRDLYIKAGTHSNPGEKITESKSELILLSLAQISSEKGDDAKAIELINKARKVNPKDMTLIQVEADMVYKQGNMKRYNELMEEMIAISPNNPDLYNNMGVASAKLGLKDKAIEYYNKAIELNPDNAGAKINIAVLILGDEAKLNEEMNALGTSSADYARYDELKEQKKGVYKKAMPFLESALQLRPDNIEIVRTLMGIYSQLGEDDKFKSMKAKLQQMEGGQ